MFPHGVRDVIRSIDGVADDAFAITPAQLSTIENKIIDAGLFMGLNSETRNAIDRMRDYKMYTPGTQFGFDLQIESCAKYDPEFGTRGRQTTQISSKRLVSLACLDECANLPQELCGSSTIDEYGSVELHSSGRPSFVEMYGSKLPLMCVNVSRLAYTTELFRYYSYKTTAIANRVPDKTSRPESFEALNFYLKIDTLNAAATFDCRARARTQPNLEFSTLLHRLQSDGYIEYIVALARRLQLNIDLLIDRNPHIVYVYKNSRCSQALGVLTAYYHASRWYVTVSDKSLTVE